MGKINEFLFLGATDNLLDLKRQLQQSWRPMAQMLNTVFTLHVQATMPVLMDNTTGLWIDNTAPAALKYYLVTNFGGTHKKVEMT